MRTTLTLDKDVELDLKEEIRRTRRPLKHVVNEALRAGLATGKRPASRRYRHAPVSLGGVVPGVDLHKALRLAEDLEDEAIARKLELRK